MTIKTRNGKQTLNVPNTEKGRAFLEEFKSYRHKGGRGMRVRGRGSRKEHGNSFFINPEHSEWLAVYVDMTEKERDEKDQTYRERWNFKNKIEELQFQLDAVQMNHGISDMSLKGNLHGLVEDENYILLKVLLNKHKSCEY